MERDDDRIEGTLGELLARQEVWAQPRPNGADDLLLAIRAETAARPADLPTEPRRLARPVSRRSGRGRLGQLAVAAVVVLVLGVGAALVASRSSSDGSEVREVAISGTELAPDATATARVEELGSGVAIELDVFGLAPAEPGTFYQAWLKGPDFPVPIGTFHMRAGDETVELWAGVALDDYPTLTVTLQTEGAGPQSSGQVVLTGRVDGN